MTIDQLFWQLGIHIGTVGCCRAILAAERVLENEDRLTRLIVEVYCPVAEQYGCHWSVVERNLRTVVQRAYKKNPALLGQLAGYTLEGPPTAGEFLEMVYIYMIRQEAKV